MSTQRWHREKLLLRLRYFASLSLFSFFSLFLSLRRTKVFPTSYNHFSRNVPTVLSHSLLDVAYLGKILFAVSSREHPRMLLLLIRSQAHRRRRILILLPKNLGWRRAPSPFARGFRTSKGRMSAIRSQASFVEIRLVLLGNYCLTQD